MTDHDPLCMSLLPYGPGSLCDCGTIRVVRADERERIAQAIEARTQTHECSRAYEHAARIARGDP